MHQGLALLKSALGASSVNSELVANLTMDVTAHMLIPFHQGMIQAAHTMDVGADAADKTAAQTEGAAYWAVVNAAVGDLFELSDRATLTALFTSPVAGDFNYCSALTRLLANLPAASGLQYVNLVRAGTLSTSVAASNVHVTTTDVGVLQAALVDGAAPVCNMPPPPSPSDPPPPSPSPSDPPPPTPPPTLPAPSTASGLSGGELVGSIAGGVAVLVLALLILCLVARACINKRQGKPIFICLDPEKPEDPEPKDSERPAKTEMANTPKPSGQSATTSTADVKVSIHGSLR